MDSPIDDLNTYLQRKKMATSLSWLEIPTGFKHEPVWTSTCKLNGVDKGTGSGKTKRLARTAAARAALATLKEEDAAAL